MLEQGEGHVFHGGGHGVHGVHGADDDGEGIGTLAFAHAHGAEVRHGGEVLPHLAFEAVLGEFFTQDGVGFAHAFEAVTGDGAEAAHAQAGAGEGLAEHHAVGQAEGLAHDAHFVLVEELHGFDEFELQVVGQAAHVVVGLHAVALEDVGVDGALGEEFDAFLLAGFFLKHADEFGTDDFALLFGLFHAGELVEEAVNSVHVDEVGVHLVAEHFHHLFGFALAEQAVVHVHAHELAADGLDEEGGHHRGVHAAGKGKQDLLVADLFADGFYLLVDEGEGEFFVVDARHGFGADIAGHGMSPEKEFSVLWKKKPCPAVWLSRAGC